MTVKTVAANCRFCGYQCGLSVTVTDGRVTGVRPDPERFPHDAAIMRRCKRWPNAPAILDHPDRVNYPLKRTGGRGSGEWSRITWDQALDEIAARLAALKDKHGPETLATSIGGPHTTYWPLHRFMTLFGSPNNMGIGQICWNPGVWVNTLTYGWHIDMELDPHMTNCAILWGVNPADSDNSLFWETVKLYRAEGKPLIVVDPRRTATAEAATLWLPVRPGADPWLALGLLHVVVRDKLYDEYFVANHCHGFDRLAEHVRLYPPSHVAGLTGLPAADIEKAARLYAAEAPSTLYTGRGLDQLGPNSIPVHHAIAALRAITGNLDYPGASHISEMPDFTPEADLELSAALPPSMRDKQLNKGKLLLQNYAAFERVRDLTMKRGGRLPLRYLTSAHPNLVWQAMLTGDPYPVRALIVMASNPLLTQADSRLIHRALHSLDLIVALELFPTSTAMLADYILPIAGVLEKPVLETKAGTANIAYGGDAAVRPYYERRPDYDFWKGLGERLGQSGQWPWADFREATAASLKPADISWEDFCAQGIYAHPSNYLKYSEIDSDTGRERGFATVSGRVELYSEVFAELGAAPLPAPQTQAPLTADFPLLLMTGARYHPYYASSHRRLPALRALHPDPWAEMDAATADRFGLAEGDAVWVETERGRARFVTKITPMNPDAVSVEYGWWYPEKPAREPGLGDMWTSNANVLTSGDYATADKLVGTWTYNGIPCRLLRAGM
ncbi:MAG: molybdopterin-dependent oxidoreductase [Gracilibacteraceae bacterium]|jgi:anaerobic selenocysteine-containing dehydrogenase|nr:molybdopterin-dependent oxidoreductase [Gracilibacteraceae bacterium]